MSLKTLKKFFLNQNKSIQNHTETDLENRYNVGIDHSLPKNMEHLKKIFHFPQNQDFIVRECQIRALQKMATIVYMLGMIDETMISNIIHSLTEDDTSTKTLDGLLLDVVNVKNSKKIKILHEAIDDILNGNTLCFIEGHKEALSFSTTKFEHRNVDKPTRENVIRGAQEAFVGSSEINRSLIRKRLRSENLVSENLVIGKRSKSMVSILYDAALIDFSILTECKRRLFDINADTVQDIAILEQWIEDRPYSLLPTLLYTERPDRAISYLMEGHVVLLMDSSSSCLILPVTFWALFHTSDDMNQRLFAGIFIRFMRLIAMFGALLTPALYLAITKFNTEMVPTDLLLSITGTRERVPFPAFIEVLLMEIAFELIREAGIRIPTAIGPTIGIVGALIIGQAAVQANIVSPILIIIVGVTGLSSYAIPENSLNYAIRIFHFILLIMGSFLGMYGIALGVMFMISYTVSLTSFGVPFLAPFSPHRKSSGDLYLRPTIIRNILRPFHMHPQDPIRQQPIKKQVNKHEK